MEKSNNIKYSIDPKTGQIICVPKETPNQESVKIEATPKSWLGKLITKHEWSPFRRNLDFIERMGRAGVVGMAFCFYGFFPIAGIAVYCDAEILIHYLGYFFLGSLATAVISVIWALVSLIFD